MNFCLLVSLVPSNCVQKHCYTFHHHHHQTHPFLHRGYDDHPAFQSQSLRHVTERNARLGHREIHQQQPNLMQNHPHRRVAYNQDVVHTTYLQQPLTIEANPRDTNTQFKRPQTQLWTGCATQYHRHGTHYPTPTLNGVMLKDPAAKNAVIERYQPLFIQK
jgi:hypothetical protein